MHKYGFTLERERELVEVGGIARLWRHDCGAKLLSIMNKDENKCFGANFYTPPTDSTGVAHILEHSVLCGSQKYPVKEPFVELLKGSLQTFLNAFTFPDKTCYPVASANLQDFYNLVDVYLDAVFHPLISREIFYQEGWHVDADSIDGPWEFKGVVYNEMKGVYSTPDSVIAEKSQQAMFPDNLYHLDSGGNPERIPDLTYASFVDFHRRCYHPANALFFFWGDDPEDERLRIISEAIGSAGGVVDLAPVPLQKPFPEPRVLEIPYAASESDDRALFTVNWLLGDGANIEDAITMEILEHILEGLPGSPLRRVLMESGLGEDTIGCGLETDLRQMYYSTGLKGVQPADVGKGEALILETLEQLATNGLESLAVEAAINSVEFDYRENNSGRMPRGLAAMIMSLSTWLYGGDPMAPLAWEKPLNNIKAAVARGEKIFENAIRGNFLENKSRARVTLFPDAALATRLETEESSRLNAMREEASPEKREEIVKETELLREKQSAPDRAENLALIPSLKLSDLPAKNAVIPREITHIPQTFITHDLPTSGIAYVNLLLPIDNIPDRLIPYIPLFARSLTEWGTANEDYGKLGMRIAAKLGELSIGPLVGARVGSRDPYAWLNLRSKAVYGRVPDMFAIIEEILLRPQASPAIIIQRLGQMILEDKARMDYSLQAAGHRTVMTRLAARYTGDAALVEMMGGVSQLWFLRDLAERLEKNPDQVLADFEELRDLLVCAKDMLFNCVGEKAGLKAVQERASALAASLPATPAPRKGVSISRYAPLAGVATGEAFITQSQVNYVGKAANLFNSGYVYSGAAHVISRWLRMGRLWEEVRVAGGAYGVFCNLDRVTGTMACASYRDPNIDKTLSAYDGMMPYLRGFTPSAAQLRQAIIGAVGDMDAYLLPDAKGFKSLSLWLSGQTEEMRQKMREEMLSTTAADFRNFADALVALQDGAICVLGGSSAMAAAIEHGWKECKLD